MHICIYIYVCIGARFRKTSEKKKIIQSDDKIAKRGLDCNVQDWRILWLKNPPDFIFY